jgi:hypothetical protein
MSILKAIVEKFKLKELIAIIFVTALLITILPPNIATMLNIIKFRETYQTYISLCLILTGAYYIVSIVISIKKFIFRKLNSWERIAINYMKNYMSSDEMELLIKTYYDYENNQFKSSGFIDYTDGCKTALESKHVIYLASQMGKWTSFAYNLQPSVRDFLNKNLTQGNIKIMHNSFEYNLK